MDLPTLPGTWLDAIKAWTNTGISSTGLRTRAVCVRQLEQPTPRTRHFTEVARASSFRGWLRVLSSFGCARLVTSPRSCDMRRLIITSVRMTSAWSLVHNIISQKTLAKEPS